MNKKPGFSGQWIEIFRTGTHTDDAGNKHEIDAAFLDSVVGNLDLDQHEPPAVIGHPKSDAPAFGWGCALRRNGESLEAQLCDTDPQFEEMVRKGLFKKRSASFYIDADKAPGGQVPALRHIGFLGAAPPAVKGLRDIHFEEGEAATFEFSEGDIAVTDAEKKAAQEEVQKTARETVTDFLKKIFVGEGSGEPAPATAAFSEADQQKLIEKATAAAEAKFSEELKKRDTKIEELTGQVNAQGGSSRRASIVSFCEANLATVIPAFKNMGLVEFMETLDDTTTNAKVSVISFAEKDGKEVEEKKEMSQLEFFQTFIRSLPPFISFGEKFGELRLKGDGSQIANPEQENRLREGMGVQKSEPAGAKS